MNLLTRRGWRGTNSLRYLDTISNHKTCLATPLHQRQKSTTTQNEAPSQILERVLRLGELGTHRAGYIRPKPSPKDKIFLALSSGIDSSVTAKLLSLTHPLENLHPVYMTNWNPLALSDRTSTLTPRLPRNKPSLAHLLPPPSPSPTTKCTTREFRQVEDLCKHLGLREPRNMNFEKEYWNDVFLPMVEGYERGETPNPDVGCNRWVKFGGLMERLEREIGPSRAEGEVRWWVATGHYADIAYPMRGNVEIGDVERREMEMPHLLRSRDPNKDQTFYLSTIPPESLTRLLFPLSHYGLTKPEVYALAREWKLPGWTPGTPERSESMGLCFVEPTSGSGLGAAGFRLFLSEFLETRTGNVVAGRDLPVPEGVDLDSQEGRPKKEVLGMPPRARGGGGDGPVGGVDDGPTAAEEGTVLGTHQGLWTATVGEKAHLSLPQGDRRFQGRWYVSGKNVEKNEIEVVRGWGNGRLWSYGMVVKGWRWLGGDCEAVVRTALERLGEEERGVKEEGEAVEEGRELQNGEDGMWEKALVIQFRHRQKPVKVLSVEVIPRPWGVGGEDSLSEGFTGSGDRANEDRETAHVKILFEAPQRAVTVGQNAAMWMGERCLGGGVICGTVVER